MEEEFDLEAAPRPEPVDALAHETDAFIAEADARLRAIELSLRALEDGSYGQCEVCGRPVGDDRLALRASERRCAEHDATAGPEPRLF